MTHNYCRLGFFFGEKSTFPHTDSGRSPTGSARMAPGPAQPPSLGRTFMTSTVHLPVVCFEVGRPGRLHQQVLDIPPGQLAAAMTKDRQLYSHRSAMPTARSSRGGALGAGLAPVLEEAPRHYHLARVDVTPSQSRINFDP